MRSVPRHIGRMVFEGAILASNLAVLALPATSSCARSDERGPEETASVPMIIRLSAEVRARAPTPGEPLKIVVTSPVPLESLDGTFLDREVTFFRGGARARIGSLSADGGNPPTEPRPSNTDTWSGWGLIDLEQDPGLRRIELRGRAVDGRSAEGSLTVTVEPKEFPVDRLEVASKYVEPPPEVQKRIEREQARLMDVYARRTPILSPAAGAFSRPVPGPPTSVFGTRRLFNGQPRSPHPGLDLRAPAGTPVRCSGPGVVALASDLYFSGNTVIVDHGGGLFTIYAHLSEIRVAEGEEIGSGGLVGLSGATGRVTAPHLHWGAKIGDLPFDPTALLDPDLFR